MACGGESSLGSVREGLQLLSSSRLLYSMSDSYPSKPFLPPPYSLCRGLWCGFGELFSLSLGLLGRSDEADPEKNLEKTTELIEEAMVILISLETFERNAHVSGRV